MKSSFALAVLVAYIQAVQITDKSLNVDGTSTQHLGSGEFTVAPGKFLGQIATTSSYDLSFDIKQTGIVSGKTANLLLFTDADLQKDQNKPPVGYGSRIPMVTLWKNQMAIYQGKINPGQWHGYGPMEWNSSCYNDERQLVIGEWSHVQISVHSNKFTASINDKEYCSITYEKQVPAFPRVNVYASHPGPYYPNALAQLKNVTYNGAILGNSAVPEIAPIPTAAPIAVPTPAASGLTFEESLESPALHDEFLTHQAPYKSENDRLAAEREEKTAAYFADFEAAKAANSHVEEAKAKKATTSDKAATDSTALEEAEKASAAAGQAHQDATADLEAKEQAATAAENMMHASKAAALAAHHEYVAHVAHGSSTGYIH